jgi:adenosylcobinamide-phosphate synthase
VAEAAFAAALDVHLGGVNRYGDRSEHRPTLGTGRAVEPGDIERAVELSRDVSTALAVVLAIAGFFVIAFGSVARAGRGRR